jgi:hypothetical protein
MEEMKGEPYKTVYADAFAGSGLVTMPKPKKERRGFGFFPASDAQPCIEGSAIQSLKLSELFDKYYFVERCPQCCAKLNKLIKSDFASLQKRISVEPEDAPAIEPPNFCIQACH